MANTLGALISGMSAAEKRFFKQQCSRSGSGKLYLRLFDLMAQPAYSDEKARKKLGVAQIRVLKFRLQEQLLKSLSRYLSLSEEYKKPDLNQVRVLQSKRLFDEAAHLLQRQLRAAREAEDFLTVLQLLDVQENLLNAHQQRAFTAKTLLRIHAEKERCLRLLQHIQQLEKLRSYLIQVRIEHAPDRLEKIPALYAKSLREFKPWLDEKKLETVSQRCLYHEIRFLQSDHEQNAGKALAHSLQRIELHRANPKVMLLTTGSYAAALNNHLIMLFKSGRLRETLPFIQLFRGLRSPNLNLQLRIFYSSNVMYTNYLIAHEEITYTEATLAPIEHESGRYEQQHEKEMTLKYNIGVLYFRLGNYKKARRSFYRLLSHPAQQKHIGLYAHVLFLISLFELGETEIFEKEAGSFINAQKKKGSAFLFEITLLGAMRTILEKNSSKKEAKRALKHFFEAKAAAMLRGKYKQAQDYFDFERYLQGRF